MTIDFLTVLITVFSLLILLIPGFVLTKAKMLTQKAGDCLSVLVLYACQPALIFMSFQKKGFDSSIALNMVYVALLTLLVHLIIIGVVLVLFRNKNDDEKKFKIKNVVKFATVFSNMGYMGFPFLQMLFTGTYEADILIYGAAAVSIFNIFNWSFGLYLITGDIKEMSPKKAFLNPTFISIIIGLASFLIIKTPIVDIANHMPKLDSFLEKFMNSVNMLGNSVTPLAMIIIGIKLANIKLNELLLNKWAYIACFMKLIVTSLISILVVAFIPVDTIVKYAIFFCMSMPSATATSMFAIKYNSDSEFASVCVLLSTILSIITIPVMFIVLSQVFGVVI